MWLIWTVEQMCCIGVYSVALRCLYPPTIFTGKKAVYVVTGVEALRDMATEHSLW